MCFDLRAAKVLDPGGYIAEKTTPKAFAPYSGLHGTSAAWKAMQPTPPSYPARTTTPAVSVTPPQSASQKLLGE